MCLTVLEIFVVSIVIMVLFFLAYYALRGSCSDKLRAASLGRLVGGSLLGGVCMGSVMAAMLFIALPTYYFIDDCTPDGYRMRFVLNSDVFDECGSNFIINNTSETFSLVAKIYGDDELMEGEPAVTFLPPGKTFIHFGVDGWFEPFPSVMSGESNGTVERYVMRQQSVKQELGKEVDYEYEPD